MSDEPDREAYVVALRLPAGRDLSESELRERLLRRAFSAGAAEAAVTRLVEQHAVDDFRVAVGRARAAAARHRGRARAAPFSRIDLAGLVAAAGQRTWNGRLPVAAAPFGSRRYTKMR